MTVTPCNHCPLTIDCGIKRSKLEGVYGLKLTKISFRCDVRKQLFKPGMKVKAHLKYVAVGMKESFDPEEPPRWPILEEREVVAIVMGWSKIGKVRVFVPYDGDSSDWWLASRRDPDKQIHVLLLWPEQLKPSPEFVSICTDCGLPKDVAFPEWNCSAWPEGGGCTSFTPQGGGRN